MKNQINLTNKDRSLYNAKFILLIDKFDSEVTSKKQLIEIFEQSDIKVIFIDEIFNNLTLEKKVEEKEDIDELKRKLLIAEQKIKELNEKLLSNKCV